MAQRIGDTLRPELGRIDYSGLGEIYARSAQNTGATIASTILGIGEAIAERREGEAQNKARGKMIDEAVKLFPNSGYLADISAFMNDPKSPYLEKKAVGESMGALLDLGISAYDKDRSFKLQERGLDLDERRVQNDSRRIDFQERDQLREIAGAEARTEEANAKALTDTISVMQPLDDLLSNSGLKDESPARKRIDKLISEGRGSEALSAAKSWADSARAEINRSMQGQNGPKLDRIGITTPEGQPGEMDVLVYPDGTILNLQGQRVTAPPQNGVIPGLPALPSPGTSAPRNVDAVLPTSPGHFGGAIDSSATVPQRAPRGLGAFIQNAARASNLPIDARLIADAIDLTQGGYSQASSASRVTPEFLQFLGQYGSDGRSNVPFGQLPAQDPNLSGMVLPNRLDGVDLSAYIDPSERRTTESPRIGVRRMVSPKETPQEALAKSRQTAGDERLNTVLKESQALSGTIDNLRQTKALLDEVRTGFGAETITKAKRMLGQDVSSAEQLQTLLGDQVMARVSQTKGSISNAEMELFKDYSASFGKTPEGNRKIVDFTIKAAERARKIQKTISDGFRTGKDPFTIEEELEKIREREPLTGILSTPAPAPGGIPVDEDSENSFFNTKPLR